MNAPRLDHFSLGHIIDALKIDAHAYCLPRNGLGLAAKFGNYGKSCRENRPKTMTRLPHRTATAVLLLVMAAASLAQPASPEAEAEPVPTVILAGHLIAEPGEPTLGPHTLLVRDGRIEKVVPGLQRELSPGARIVDLSDAHVLPGLIDAHMHLAIDMHADTATSTSDARLALSTAGYARRLLRAGVTTVRDVGDNGGVVYAVRDAINAGSIEGPRILAAGRVVSRTGGHGAKRPSPVELPFVPASCDGSESCRRVVRENIEAGADWIKITVSGSGREAGGRPDALPNLFDDEVESAIAAARQATRPVAAHAHSTAAINLALRAGARTIEHGTYFDDASVALFKRKQAYLVPTAFVADYVGSRLDMFAGGRDGRSQDDLRQWVEAAKAGPGRAWRAGVPLALGTDGGPSFDVNATAREVALYVASGVPAPAALRAATAGNADALAMGDTLGRLRAGAGADIIAVPGDPQADAAQLQHVRMVMKDGRLVCLDDCGDAASPAGEPAK